MNWKRFAAILAAAALCLSALAGCSQAPSPAGSAAPSPSQADGVTAPRVTDNGGGLLSAILAKGEIVVAMEGTWSPWTYHDESGALVGYDVEVAQAIADHLGVKATFVEGEWDGLLAGLEAGRYDIIVNGVNVDEDRKAKYDFSTPYAYDKTAVIVRGDDDSIQAMEDLAGKHTANTIASTYAAVAQKYGAEVTAVDDLNQTFELLLTGRIDATLNAEGTFYDYLKAHPDANAKIACIDPDFNETAIPVRKGEETASLLAEINEALEEMRQSGALSQLAVKYFGTDLSKRD